MKKIAFISPRGSFFFNATKKIAALSDLISLKSNNNYWSGLSTTLPLLAALTPDKYEVTIIDENIEPVAVSSEYDLVAVTGMTHQALRAYLISGEFRKLGIPVIMGGCHASALPEEAEKFVDAVVIGEAEQVWPKLLEDFENNRLKKIYHGKDYGPVDPAQLPIPRYDLLKDKGYSVIWMDTRRGCPYDCEFCSVTEYFGKKQRFKTIPQIHREMEYVQKEFKSSRIQFADDNLFSNHAFARKFVAAVSEHSVQWAGQTDITLGDDAELLKMVRESGCEVLLIGLESLAAKNIEGFYKNSIPLKLRYLSRYAQMIDNIQTNGIGVLGSFIVGLDHDTMDSLRQIYEFIEQTKMLNAFINILTPLPGTRLRQKLLNENRVLPTSWDNYTFDELNFIPKLMSALEIEKGVLDAYQKIYSEERMSSVMDHFKQIYSNLRKSKKAVEKVAGC